MTNEVRGSLVTAAYNAVTGADGEWWGPERSQQALEDLFDAGVAEGLRRAREEADRG